MRFGHKARAAFKEAQQSGEDFDEVVIDKNKLVNQTLKTNDAIDKQDVPEATEAATDTDAQATQEAPEATEATTDTDTQVTQEASEATEAATDTDAQVTQEAPEATEAATDTDTQATQEAREVIETTSDTDTQATQEAPEVTEATSDTDTQATQEAPEVIQDMINSLSGSDTPLKTKSNENNHTAEQILLIEQVGMFNRSLENIYNIAAIPHGKGKVLLENTNVDVKFKETQDQIDSKISSLNKLNLGSHYLCGELHDKKNRFIILLQDIVDRREERKSTQRAQQANSTLDTSDTNIPEPSLTPPQFKNINEAPTPPQKADNAHESTEGRQSQSKTLKEEFDENSPDRIAHVNPKYQQVSQSSLTNAQASFDNKDYGNRFIAKPQTPVHALVNSTRIKEVKSSFFLRDIHKGLDLTEHYCEHSLLRNGSIKDYGNMFDFTGTNRKANAKMAIKLANKMGWNTIACSGNPKFMAELGSLATKFGIQIIPIDTRNSIQSKPLAQVDMAEVSKQMNSQTPNAANRTEQVNQKSAFQNVAKKTAEGTVDLTNSSKGDNCLSNILKEEVNPTAHNPIVRNMN
ncbi:hypothetical protein [Vibrio splendidus]|uniref:hypothetical protein n=1 Tax=Vibrio splendidus TaxID=29497 RepID=UPI00352BEF57